MISEFETEYQSIISDFPDAMNNELITNAQSSIERYTSIIDAVAQVIDWSAKSSSVLSFEIILLSSFFPSAECEAYIPLIFLSFFVIVPLSAVFVFPAVTSKYIRSLQGELKDIARQLELSGLHKDGGIRIGLLADRWSSGITKAQGSSYAKKIWRKLFGDSKVIPLDSTTATELKNAALNQGISEEQVLARGLALMEVFAEHADDDLVMSHPDGREYRVPIKEVLIKGLEQALRDAGFEG